jgi:hypothetical protein
MLKMKNHDINLGVFLTDRTFLYSKLVKIRQMLELSICLMQFTVDFQAQYFSGSLDLIISIAESIQEFHQILP